MSNQSDRVPAAVCALVELFEQKPELRFPELDASVLQDAVAEVERVSEEVERAEAELLRQRELLALRQDGLIAKAQRALAYARVFAEEDPLLTDQLAQLSLPRARKATSLQRAEPASATAEQAEAPVPTRRRKSTKQSEALFGEATAPAAAS